MAGSGSNGDDGPGGGAGANAYGMQDEPEIRLPREVSRSYNARVLDPSTARRGPGATPSRSTVYLADRLLVRGLPGSSAADRIDRLRTVAEGLKRPIDVQASRFDRRVGSRLADSPAAETAHDAYLTRLDLRWANDDSARPMDAWELLATARAAGAVQPGEAELDHLMTACGYWDGHGTQGYWDGHGYWAGHGGEYGRPGYGPRTPVAWSAADPSKGIDPGPRPPVVAMLDTGIGDHPWFTGHDRVRHIEEIDGVPVCSPRPGESGPPGGDRDGHGVADPLSGLLAKLAGHGTFIAGIVRQTCPSATLLSLPVMGCSGAASEGDVQVALALLLDRHVRAQTGLREGGTGIDEQALLADIVDVITLSMGYYHEDGTLAQDETALRQVLGALTEAGVLVVAAAGNDATTTPLYPAGWAANSAAPPPADVVPLVSVGAQNPSDGSVAMFSNGGDWVTCHRPGAFVVSTVPPSFDGSAQATMATTTPDGLLRRTMDPDNFASGFAMWSGTSFAAPLLAGQVAQRIVGAGQATAVDAPSMRSRTRAALGAELGWGTS